MHDSKRIAFAEVGEFTFSWHQYMNCCRGTVFFFDVIGLRIPMQSFILARFTLSLPCSAPCGTGQATIDTGCNPALLHNCVDHLTHCNLLKKYHPIKFTIIQPLTLNNKKNLRNCQGVPNGTTCLTL